MQRLPLIPSIVAANKERASVASLPWPSNALGSYRGGSHECNGGPQHFVRLQARHSFTPIKFRKFSPFEVGALPTTAS